jgi:hypothetical protein
MSQGGQDLQLGSRYRARVDVRTARLNRVRRTLSGRVDPRRVAARVRTRVRPVLVGVPMWVRRVRLGAWMRASRVTVGARM